MLITFLKLWQSIHPAMGLNGPADAYMVAAWTSTLSPAPKTTCTEAY